MVTGLWNILSICQAPSHPREGTGGAGGMTVLRRAGLPSLVPWRWTARLVKVFSLLATGHWPHGVPSTDEAIVVSVHCPSSFAFETQIQEMPLDEF